MPSATPCDPPPRPSTAVAAGPHRRSPHPEASVGLLLAAAYFVTKAPGHVCLIFLLKSNREIFQRTWRSIICQDAMAHQDLLREPQDRREGTDDPGLEDPMPGRQDR